MTLYEYPINGETLGLSVSATALTKEKAHKRVIERAEEIERFFRGEDGEKYEYQYISVKGGASETAM